MGKVHYKDFTNREHRHTLDQQINDDFKKELYLSVIMANTASKSVVEYQVVVSFPDITTEPEIYVYETMSEAVDFYNNYGQTRAVKS